MGTTERLEVIRLKANTYRSKANEILKSDFTTFRSRLAEYNELNQKAIDYEKIYLYMKGDIDKCQL